jgi:ATP-dependent helicase/nuclease subunit B
VTIFSLQAVFLPLGFRLFDTLETLHAGEVLPEQIAALLPEETLANYYRAFYTQPETQHYWTPARRFRTVAERLPEVDFSPYDRIVLAGLYALSAVELRLVRYLLSLPQTVGLFLSGPGLKEMLLGLQVSYPEVKEEKPALPEVHFYHAPDRHGQVFALAAKLAAQREKANRPICEHTVAVLPAADSLFAVLSHAISVLPQGDPYNVSLGYPLSRTPVVAFLRTLLNLADSRTEEGNYDSQAYYMHFIHHPYTKNLRFGQRTDVTRILMHTLEAHLIQNSRTRIVLEALEEDPSLFEVAARQALSLDPTATAEALKAHFRALHNQTLRRLLQAATLTDWTQRTIEVLAYIAAHSTARLHPYFDRFFERLIEGLEALGRSLLGNLPLERPGNYLRLLESLWARQRVPFEGTPVSGLQVLGLLETRGPNFETVYVLDANEDVLPAAEDPDPFLPDAVRRSLGLPTEEDQQRLVRYHVENLIRGAREVHVFYMENPRQGERSRFVEQLIWELEQQQGKIQPPARLQSVSYKLRLHARRPEPIAKTQAVLDVLRALPYGASAARHLSGLPPAFLLPSCA